MTGEILAVSVFAFVVGYCVPLWFLMSCAQRLKETNSLMRHLIALQSGAESAEEEAKQPTDR